MREWRHAARETWPAVLLAAFALVEAWVVVPPDDRLVAALTAPVMTLPLAARRRAPVPAMAVTLVATYGREWIGVELNEGVTPILVMLLGLYAVGMYAAERLAVAGLAGSLLFVLATMIWSEDGAADFPFIALFLVGPWAAGRALRVRQDRAALLEARADRAEREREAEARRAVAEERTRIARELHDVVAHSVSVMTVQAGAVRRTLRADQPLEREVLEQVEATGRQALTELRRLLGLLRDTDAGPALTPQPGLGQLEALVGQVREAGLPVRLEVSGAPTALPPGVDLSAYRIVQEALTNVLKHAGPTPTHVVVRYGADDLRLEVRDEGGGALAPDAAGNGGHGLIGMRERVAMYGGELEAGPVDRGYAVRARLPLA